MMQDEESESTESHVMGDGCMQCKHFLFFVFRKSFCTFAPDFFRII